MNINPTELFSLHFRFTLTDGATCTITGQTWNVLTFIQRVGARKQTIHYNRQYCLKTWSMLQGMKGIIFKTN